jgi:hypothetical protein
MWRQFATGAQIETEMQRQRFPRASCRFTDAFEKNDGQWQIVWPPSTGIA